MLSELKGVFLKGNKVTNKRLLKNRHLKALGRAELKAII